MSIVRKHYYIGGRVQGVGFRYRAYYMAQSYGLTGFACNLDDGRVEMEVQGQADAIAIFLDQLSEGTFIHITNIESYNMELKDDNGFRVY